MRGVGSSGAGETWWKRGNNVGGLAIHRIHGPDPSDLAAQEGRALHRGAEPIRTRVTGSVTPPVIVAFSPDHALIIIQDPHKPPFLWRREQPIGSSPGFLAYCIVQVVSKFPHFRRAQLPPANPIINPSLLMGNPCVELRIEISVRENGTRNQHQHPQDPNCCKCSFHRPLPFIPVSNTNLLILLAYSTNSKCAPARY